MTSPDSPIISFYPNDFETDLNGKQHDWEAVVLIPFIDEVLFTLCCLFKYSIENQFIKKEQFIWPSYV